MDRMIAFNETSLRYFLYHLSGSILECYAELIPDDEDIRVVEEIIEHEISCLVRSIEQKKGLL